MGKGGGMRLICYDCGINLGERLVILSSWRQGICEWCYKTCRVADSKDFGVDREQHNLEED